MDYKDFQIDADEKSEGDFESLPEGFDMATAVAVLRVVMGYSQNWEKFYETEHMIDAAKSVLEANNTSEIFRSDGAAHGASMVRQSVADDWASFLENLSSR